MKRIFGPKPLIHYSHLAALKVFKQVGFKFEVRHFGESRLGLLRWSLRKIPPGFTPRRLVMAPGFGDSPLSWVTLLVGMQPVLKRKVDEILIVDYPGYSGFLHNELAIDTMDELLRCFNEVLGTLKPEILIGHSLGGWLAADYATRTPELKELILIDPGGVVGTEAEKETYRELFQDAVKSGPKKLVPHAFHKKPLWLPFVARQFFYFLNSPEISNFVHSFEEKHLLNDRVHLIRAKTTLLWGEYDTMTPVAWLNKWMELLIEETNVRGILVRKSGHSPQIEKPGVLMALLTQLFLDLEPSRLSRIPFWKVLTAKEKARSTSASI